MSYLDRRGYKPLPSTYPADQVGISTDYAPPADSSWGNAIFMDASAGDVSVTMNFVTIPTQQGQNIIFKMDNTPNQVIVLPGVPGDGQTLDGSTSPYILTEPGSWVVIFQNGTNKLRTLSSSNVQKLASGATLDHIATLMADGQVKDSGKAFTDTVDGSSTADEIPTALAVQQAIVDMISSVFNFRGGYDASTNLFPETGGSGPGGAIQRGDTFRITVSGTLGGTPVIANATDIVALEDTPGQTSTEWSIKNYGVNSFKGRFGAVIPQTGDYDVDQVTGAAPLDSPEFIGMPTVPDLPPGDSSTKAVNSNYVDTSLANALNEIVYYVDNGTMRANPIVVPVEMAFTFPKGTYSGLYSQLGYTLKPGDRVLLTMESDSSNNVVWVVGYDSPTYTWDKAPDMATSYLIRDTFFKVLNGFEAGLYYAIASVTDATGELTSVGTQAAGSITRSMATTPNGKFFYAANQGDSSISMYSASPSAGILTPLSPATLSLGSGITPEAIQITGDGRFAYTANFGNETISVLSINQTTGQLAVAQTVSLPAASDPVAITIYPGDKFLYVALSSAGQVAQFSINPTDGNLTPLSPATVAAGTNPNSLVNRGGFLYAGNLNSSNISQYSIDDTTGLLTPLSPATVSTAAGIFSLAITTPSLGFTILYALKNTGGVDQFSQAGNGLLTPLSTPSFTTGASPRGIAVSTRNPFTRFLYVANDGDNTLSQYSISSTDPFIAPLSPATVATGNLPVGVIMSANGKFVYVANSGVGNIQIYSTGFNYQNSPAGLSWLALNNINIGTFTSSSLQLRIAGVLNNMPVPTFNQDTTGNAATATTATTATTAITATNATNAVNATNATTATTAGNVTGIVAIANGGTGASTALGARNNILPTQVAGMYLGTDGTAYSLSYPLELEALGVANGQSVNTAAADITNGSAKRNTAANFGISVNDITKLQYNLTAGEYDVEFACAFAITVSVAGAQAQMNPCVLVSGTGTITSGGMRAICTAHQLLGPLPAGVATASATITVPTGQTAVIKPQLGTLSGGTATFSIERYKITRKTF